ncbi:MAG: P-loop NTPase [Culicoidibacterales bacterium]
MEYANMLSDEQIREFVDFLFTLNHPYTKVQLEESDIAEMAYEGDLFILKFNFPYIGTEQEVGNLKRKVLSKLKLDFGLPKVRIEFLEDNQKPVEEKYSHLINNPKLRVIAVVSGKGGVGKSTIAIAIAKHFAKQHKTALIDFDIHGSSIFGFNQIQPEINVIDGKLYPYQFENIEMMSASIFAQSDEALAWRAAMLRQILESMLYEVVWSEQIQTLIIDMPPGTGDVLLDFMQMYPDAEVLLVTTPDKEAAKIAMKSGKLLKKHGKQTILGVVENMSYLMNGDVKMYPFGQGGSHLIAETLAIPELGSIPLFSDKAEQAVALVKHIDEMFGGN